MPRFLLATILGLSSLTACTTSSMPSAEQQAPAGIVETVSEDEILQQTIILDAPVAEVWDAFTTSDGYMAWATPFAHIDFGIGGHIESSYEPDAVLGSADNIKLEILAYLPEELLVLKTVQAPPGFASQETLDRLVSVFGFEALNDTQTRLTISGVGYGEDEESKRLREFFIEGNAYSLRALHNSFAQGPTDWEEIFAARPAQQ